MNPKLVELCKYKEQAKRSKRKEKSARSKLLSLLMRSLSSPVGENLIKQFEAGDSEKFAEALTAWSTSIKNQVK